jgi:hypothetical protein
MPGYLTHAMILIRTDQFLAELEEALEQYRRQLSGQGKCIPPLEARLLRLARAVRRSLQPPPQLQLPRADVEDAFDATRRGVGDGYSQHAFVGSIGPDLPEAGYIFALNQRWAANTMHGGGARRSYATSPGTDDFALALLDQIREPGTPPELRNALRAYSIGHLSHVAADVVLNPFIQHWTWEHGGDDPHLMQRHRFELELDARVARGFFRRRDLYHGPSWTRFYLDRGSAGDAVNALLEAYRAAFVAAHGGDRPEPSICGVSDGKCAPVLDEKFLADSYANIVEWAIDAGYDHGPEGLYVLGTGLVLGSYVLLYHWLVSDMDGFQTWGNKLFGWLEEENEAIAAGVRQKWEEKGFPANESAWYSAIGNSISASDLPFMGLSLVLAGGAPKFLSEVPVLRYLTHGMFGQGKLDSSLLKTVVSTLLIIKKLAFFGLKEGLPTEMKKAGWRWSKLGVDVASDLWKQLHLNRNDLENAAQGDPLGRAFWPVQRGLTLLFLGGAVTVYLTRSIQTNDDGTRVNGWRPADFFAGLVLPLVGIAVLCSGKVLDFVLREAAGLALPRPATPNIAPYLPEEAAGEGPVSWSAHGARRFGVRLFADTALQQAEDGGARFYPEETGLPYWAGDRRQRDEALRRERSVPSARSDYTLAELFEDATRLSALLAMASVNYQEAGPSTRERASRIFHDWNLDYRTVDEWQALLNAEPGPDTGLIPALGHLLEDVRAGRDAIDIDSYRRLLDAFAIFETGGAIEANFSRNGHGPDSVINRCARLDAPGAILLPNLDIDTPVSTPLPAVLPDRTALLDAMSDDVINADNDVDELTAVTVRRPDRPGPALDIVLRIDAADARRVRIFEVGPGTPDTWPRRFGAGSAGDLTEYTLPPGTDPLELRIEALTLAGDPRFAPPAGPAPLPPRPDSPGGQDVSVPLAATRAAGEVWLELVHVDGGAEVPDLRDVGRFTIAPWLMAPNTQPTERVYVVYFSGAAGNHPTVADLIAGVTASLGAARVAVATRAVSGGGVEFVPHRPLPPGDAAAAKALYLIDGDLYRDQWVQDQFESGYCSAPHARLPTVVHVPRARGLSKWVVAELPGRDLGLFNGVGPPPVPPASWHENSLNYGGNLEVSMPVGVDTPAQSAGSAGPAVSAHAPARLGKILLGEGDVFLFDVPLSHAADLDAASFTPALRSAFAAETVLVDPLSAVRVVTAGSEWLVDHFGGRLRHRVRRDGGRLKVSQLSEVDVAYRNFLVEQRIQPIVPLETSWLHVGHVDEYLSIIPATTGGKSFRLLMSSSALGVQLLEAALTLHSSDTSAHPLTNMFRGRRWAAPVPAAASGFNAEISVADTLVRAADFNRALQIARLSPIEARLAVTLDLAPDDFVHTPVLFDSLPPALAPRLGAILDIGGSPHQLATSAFTPGMVNLLVVDTHLMVPRPFGPRMRRSDIESILAAQGVSVGVSTLDGLAGHPHWARRGATAAAIGATYGLGGAAILAANAGKFTGAGAVRDNWARIHIPEDNVDLFEAYTVATLAPLGLTIHFTDDWDTYHRHLGEVHCGTNVLRRMPEEVSGFSGPYWWDVT